MPCHQDTLYWSDDGCSLLMRYVTKYVAQFSDASYDEWLTDEGAASRGVLGGEGLPPVDSGPSALIIRASEL
eukprot:1580282-Amphidinium_carterae.1